MARMTRETSQLRWYLFEEYVTMLEQSGYPQQRANLTSSMKRQLVLYSRFRLAGRVFWTFTGVRRKAISRTGAPVFLSDHEPRRYRSIFREASRTARVYCTNSHAAFYLRRNVFYLPILGVLEALYSGILSDDEDLLNQSIEKLRKVMKEINPDVAVLSNDAMPHDRAVILVARELGVPTVEIQHGIYQSNAPLHTGRYVDYVFVWGDYFKQLYLKQNLGTEDTIKVLGYPYDLKPLPVVRGEQRLNVYYLGQNFEVYDSELLQVKLETLDALDKTCKKLGFEFTYRPHPGDRGAMLQGKLPEVRFSPQNETLEKSSVRGDIFISFNSTTLVEMALRGKLCIQLRNYPLSTDNFQDLGICPRSLGSVEEAEDYLKEIGETGDPKRFYRSVDSKYIQVPQPDPGTAFVGLIKEIIK